MGGGESDTKKNPYEARLKISYQKLLNRLKREQMNVNWINLNLDENVRRRHNILAEGKIQSAAY